MKYYRVNHLLGFLVFTIATTVYAFTVEETMSLWDCAEFIASSYKLQIPHPPGAPLYLLLGRMFSLFALGNEQLVALCINMLSVLSSGLTVLLLFHSIRMMVEKTRSVKSANQSHEQRILILAGSSIGSMAFAFSDSFWFSATEAEVYALSSFFTAFMLWAILKWERFRDRSYANRWLILISYMVGLSIGVHLLNLVTIPVLGLIYYFHEQQKVTARGILVSLFISFGLIALIMVGIIPGIPSLAGSIEIFFVNSLGLLFGSGMAFFLVVFLAALMYGIYFTHRKRKILLNTVLLCLTFILIGYSSYTLILVRSSYDPPIDQNDPETLISFVSYLKREQYGSKPIFYGPYFTAELVAQQEGSPVYEKGEDSYIVTNYRLENEYDPKESTFFPRAYSQRDNHAELYRNWMGLRPGESPDFIDNLYYFFRYQVGHMYMRYFLWNFAGRESDLKDAAWLAPWNNADTIPATLASNKARNNFYMLPLLLGLIGLFFQYRQDLKGFSIVGLFFVLTGLGLVVYLNVPPVEPRERDYIFVGAFYAFAIWIGFGVMGVGHFIKQYFHHPRVAASLAAGLSLTVPLVMAMVGWDDHDRSDRFFSVDAARNQLASCAPNAILFTGGDNDTFPLWYIQEVEGFRTDVRVIVLSYFNTDWYIEQMTRQAYQSAPLPISLDEENYKQGGPNDYLPYVERPNIKGAISLQQFLKLVRQNSSALKIPNARYDYNTIPSKTFFLDIETIDVSENKEQKTVGLRNHADFLPHSLQQIIPKDLQDLYQERLYFEVRKRALEKKDLMMLDLIATNKWQRPIYFNNTSLVTSNIDFRPFVVQEGNAFRLLPLKNPDPANELINTHVMYNNLMQNFQWRELDNPNVYYTEDHRMLATNHRSAFNVLARKLIEEGDIKKAKEVLLKSLEVMPDVSIPYDFVSAQMLDLLIEVGEIELALDMAKTLGQRADEMLAYMFEKNRPVLNMETRRQLAILNEVAQALSRIEAKELSQKYSILFNQYLQSVNELF